MDKNDDAKCLQPQVFSESVNDYSSLVATASAAVLLTGCGGGGGGSSTPVPVTISDASAVRFLSQAGFSASPNEVAAVKSQGYADWLDAQLALPVQNGSRYDWMVANGYAVSENINNHVGMDSSIWRKFLSSPDQVRQRMTLALSEIFVVSVLGLPINWRALAIAHYADLLERHAFGNYRQLLQDVTLSVAMGTYLNMSGNR